MNELSTQLSTIDSIEQMETVSKKLAASGLMGKNTTPGMVFGLMLLCQSEGIHPITAMKRYHIVEGRPSMRADAMQAEFIAHGGAIIFHVRTDQMVSATFFRSRELLNEEAQARGASRFETMWKLDTESDDQKRSKLMVEIAKLSRDGEETIIRTFADCQEKGITEGRDGTKANWKTSPRQMLTARVITEGVRLVNPGLIAGIYNEDETADIVRQEREAQAKMLAAPSAQDADAIRDIIAGYDEELKTATDSRRKTLLGLRSDLVCKLGDLGVSVCEAPAEPHPTVLGQPAKNVTPVEIPKHETKAEAKAEVLPPAAKIPWQDVVCHIGKPGGAVHNKKLVDIIPPTRPAKQIPSIEKFFNEAEVEFKDDPLIPALVTAAREGIKAWQVANNVTQPAEKEKAAARPAEAPQEAPKAQGSKWQDFVIESKDETLNGKKMGELTTPQLQFIGDWLEKVDKKGYTPYQKKLAANYALYRASTGTAEPELPAHVRELDKRLAADKIEPEKFLAEMKMMKMVSENYTSVTQVTAEEAEALFENWESVKEACDTIDV